MACPPFDSASPSVRKSHSMTLWQIQFGARDSHGYERKQNECRWLVSVGYKVHSDGKPCSTVLSSPLSLPTESIIGMITKDLVVGMMFAREGVIVSVLPPHERGKCAKVRLKRTQTSLFQFLSHEVKLSHKIIV